MVEDATGIWVINIANQIGSRTVLDTSRKVVKPLFGSSCHRCPSESKQANIWRLRWDDYDRVLHVVKGGGANPLQYPPSNVE